MADGDSDRSGVRRQLTDELGKAIRAVLEKVPQKPSQQPAFAETSSTYDRSVFFEKKEMIAIRQNLYTEHEERCFVRPQGAKVFLRIIPTKSTEELSSIQACTLAKAGQLQPFSLTPMRGGEWYSRNKYGAIVYRTLQSTIEQLTQILKNRELWGMNQELDRAKQRFGFGLLADGWESAFLSTLQNYLGFARDQLLLTPPLRLIAGITGIEGFKIAAPYGMAFGGLDPYGGRAVEPDVIFETTMGDWNCPPQEIMMPFFEMVWEAFGLERPVRPNT